MVTHLTDIKMVRDGAESRWGEERKSYLNVTISTMVTCLLFSTHTIYFLLHFAMIIEEKETETFSSKWTFYFLEMVTSCVNKVDGKKGSC